MSKRELSPEAERVVSLMQKHKQVIAARHARNCREQVLSFRAVSEQEVIANTELLITLFLRLVTTDEGSALPLELQVLMRDRRPRGITRGDFVTAAVLLAVTWREAILEEARDEDLRALGDGIGQLDRLAATVYGWMADQPG